MSIDMTVLVRRTIPNQTILFLGAGSSIPSGGPSATELAAHFCTKFNLKSPASLGLSDIATLVEKKYSRRALVDALADILNPLQPMRGILNISDYDWAGIYTTNYDDIIEKSYKKQQKPLHVVASNFDFSDSMSPEDTLLYKIHGTITQDVSLGYQHRLVLSASDYDLANDYRECLYAKFCENLYTKNAIIIGYSLGDPDFKVIIDQAIRLKRQKGAPGRMTLLVYQANEEHIFIYETRGLDVCVGGIDEFFAEMGKHAEPAITTNSSETSNPLDCAHSLNPSTVIVSCARSNETGNLARMFNGSPANYADIMREWTFHREFAEQVEAQMVSDTGKRIACVLGAAGCGKTTGIRKALTRLVDRGIDCWEHVKEFALLSDAWGAVDQKLRALNKIGVLFIDDAHENLHNVNDLVERICSESDHGLKLILASSKPHWNPRLKAASIFSQGKMYEIRFLSIYEINSLLDVLETRPDVAALVERSFVGFSRAERQRRLMGRCQSDMFVCMKNIFASEPFDQIVIREYNELIPDYQQIYKRVAGMEAAGIKVHRQLVIRAIGVEASHVERYLGDLDGIIEEETINERHGIYAWRIRHSLIANIIARFKIDTEEEAFTFLSNIIDHLLPNYEIEMASINEMCSSRGGISRIYDKNKQNILLRKMISMSPRQRVPRHRLITNLIELGDFEQASAEIRLFENELRIDGPVQRYRVKLLLERARQARGLLDEDRAVMVREAAALAEIGVKRFSEDKNMYRAYLEVGLAYLKYRKEASVLHEALLASKVAYERILDPDLERIIRRYEQAAPPLRA